MVNYLIISFTISELWISRKIDVNLIIFGWTSFEIYAEFNIFSEEAQCRVIYHIVMFNLKTDQLKTSMVTKGRKNWFSISIQQRDMPNQ